MTTEKLLKIAALMVLVLAMALVGCEGDEGPAGPAGPAGPTGPAGPAGDDGADGENALNTCSDCHNDDSQLMAIQMQFQAGAHYETVYWPRTGSCTACHNHNGFIAEVVNGETPPEDGWVFDNPVPINCRTCHQIHSEFDGDDYALTTTSAVDLITGGTHDHGNGNLCANCHQARPISPEPVIGGDPVTIGNFRYGPHYAPQSNILSGNAMYEFEGTASYDVGTPHQTACTACHMITPVAEYGMDSYVAGGHVFALSYDDEGDNVEAIGACTQCHSTADSFDYRDGQTNTMELMDQLAALLIDEGVLREDNYANAGTFDADVVAAFLNYKFIYHDHSYGVHNPYYVRALLTNTIEAMEARP